MRKTLFLHIGCHRTATTSIQQFLFGNRKLLLPRGYFYPLQVARHQRLMNQLFSGRENAADVGKSLSNRAKELKPEIHTLVLSDEDISTHADLTPLLGFREHFDVKIVFSMRRQDQWLESWYFQNIKWQWNPKLSHCTFDEFLALRDDFHWIDYDRFVRRLEDLFGAENLMLNVFEKDQMPGGPVVSFCRQIGLTDLSPFSDPPHVNSSMSAEMVEFVRHLPLDMFAPAERDLLRRALEKVDREVLNHSGKQSERLMPPEQRRAIMAEFEEGNRSLAQRHFDRDRLFLDPLPAEDAPLAKLEIPADSITAIERFVAPLLQQLVANGNISAPKKGNK